MRRNIRVKPGKTQSLVGMIAGIIFVGIGLFVAIPTFGLFGIFWTLIAALITGMNAVNAFSEKGIPTSHIEIDDGYYGEYGNSIEDRLKEAETLYNKGLISSEEYKIKREEILKDL